jgi:4-amino-4-deoxy-L-arabinose transferase-like glycosyltransferase
MRNNYLFGSFAALKKSNDNASNSAQLTVFFILGFALIYLLLPSFWYQSILPDSAQNLSWGHTWSWSYNRHPPLGTWLISLMSIICGTNEIATFTASVVCLSVSLLFIYLLSKRFLGAQDAFVACIFSSLSLYYLTNFVLQFNQNTIMLPFWIMICYFLDCCLRTHRVKDWIFLALVTAGAILAKYESLLIILIALLYLLWHFEYKFISKLLMALVIQLAILTPHLASVAHHGFLTLEFIQSKANEGQSHSAIYTHLYYPIKALFEQLCHLMPALALLALSVKSKNIIKSRDINKAGFNYLVYLGVAPLGLVILLSFILGLKIQPEWGFPLFSFTIPALMSCFQLKSKTTFLKPLLFTALAFHLGSLGMYMAFNYYTPKFARTNNPSYLLAIEALQYWNQFSNEPIRYVAGDENYDYYLAAYLPTKPLLLEAYSLKLSPWLSKKELKESGLMMVIEGCDRHRNKALKKQFSAQAYQCINIPYSNKYREQYKSVTLMVVPPRHLE